MMALRPETIRHEAIDRFDSRQEAFATEFRHLRAYGPHAFGWMMQDLNMAGAVGDARLAEPWKGEELLRRAVEGLLELLLDMDRFDAGRLSKT